MERLQNGALAMEQSADALKAEGLGNLTFIVQTNNLRQTTKTKHKEIKRLNGELDDEQNTYSFMQSNQLITQQNGKTCFWSTCGLKVKGSGTGTEWLLV